MSKGLEALERFKQTQMLADLDWNNRIEIIEKELKALDFIRTWLKDDFFVYFKLEEDSICIDGSSYLPKEEYELLKEVLK